VKLAAIGIAAAASFLPLGAVSAQAAPPGGNSFSGVPVGKLPHLPLEQLPLNGTNQTVPVRGQ
jgi:hypothetical protein